MRKLFILILVILIIYNVAAQAPPPAPLEPPPAPLDGNLIYLLLAGIGYSVNKFYKLKHPAKNSI